MKNRQKNGNTMQNGGIHGETRTKKDTVSLQSSVNFEILITNRVKLSARMAGCLLHIINTISCVVILFLILSEEKLG